MDAEDHMLTASWGNGASAQAYRAWQAQALREGRFLDVLGRDIQDVNSVAPGKYNAAIQGMLDYLWSGKW